VKVQDYIDYIRTMLASKFVNLEIDTDLENAVKVSLQEIQEYITYPKIVTVPYSECIDLSKYKVRSVLQVYRSYVTDSIAATAGGTDAFLLAAGMIQGVPYDLNRYMNLIQIRKIKNTIADDLDWIWDDPRLWITQNPIQAANVTIEYTPVIDSVEQITDQYWIGKLRKLCLANAKIITARARGKYKLNNAMYDNDADVILAEGNAEKNALMAFLESNSDLVLPR